MACHHTAVPAAPPTLLLAVDHHEAELAGQATDGSGRKGKQGPEPLSVRLTEADHGVGSGRRANILAPLQTFDPRQRALRGSRGRVNSGRTDVGPSRCGGHRGHYRTGYLLGLFPTFPKCQLNQETHRCGQLPLHQHPGGGPADVGATEELPGRLSISLDHGLQGPPLHGVFNSRHVHAKIRLQKKMKT